MAFYQFDASGIVKRYAVETGSGWVTSICASSAGNQIGLATISKVEVASALARKCREGYVSVADRDKQRNLFLHDCATQYRLTRLNEIVMNLAIDLTQRHPLRAYDAVQVSTAILVNRGLVSQGLPPLVFVSADDRCLVAAQAEGLAVENPNLHP